jgi:ATP-binding cassette subfamily B protein
VPKTSTAAACRRRKRVRQSLFEWLHCVSRHPAEVGFLLLAAGSVEWLLTAQWSLFALVGWYMVARSERVAERTRRLAEDRSQAELNQLTAGLGHARLVRGYGMDAVESEQFQTRMDRHLEQQRVQDRIQDNPLWLRLATSLVVSLLAAFLLVLLGAKTLAEEITLPGAGVFVAAFCWGMASVARWWKLPALRSNVAVTADPIWRYLDQMPTVSQAVGAKFLQPLAKTLHMERLTYVAPDRRVMVDHLDLQLKGGRSYALLSLDPLEAKAFAYLLPRFLEPQTGRILFDGEDIAWGTLESLRVETVFVSADDPPLPGTVIENIRAGRADVTLQQATDAAKEARAHHFISRLPQGYETVLSGNDDALDAGQRFRLALARALLRNPSVMIIEEPEAPLDDDSKQLLDDTYNRICENRTVFFLPHRLSTVRRCDDILFFQHGRIEAYGPHALLVKESPLYRHWEYLHFNEFRHDGAAG